MDTVQWNSIDKIENGLKYSKNDNSFTLPQSQELYMKHNFEVSWSIKGDHQKASKISIFLM